MTQFPDSILRIMFEYGNIDIRYHISINTTFDELEWYRNITRTPSKKFYIENRIFLAACEANNLTLAKELKYKLQLLRTDCLGYELSELGDKTALYYISDISTLNVVCAKGHLYILQWLISEFKIGHDELNVKDGMLFSASVFGGTQIFEYMQKQLPAPSNMRLDTTFTRACEYGFLNMCKLLFETYGDRLKESLLKYLTRACVNNKLDVAKYIATKIPKDFRTRGEYADTFRFICSTSNLKVLKWYVKHFNITQTEITLNNLAFNNINSRGNKNMSEWISKLAGYEKNAMEQLMHHRLHNRWKDFP